MWSLHFSVPLADGTRIMPSIGMGDGTVRSPRVCTGLGVFKLDRDGGSVKKGNKWVHVRQCTREECEYALAKIQEFFTCVLDRADPQPTPPDEYVV